MSPSCMIDLICSILITDVKFTIKIYLSCIQFILIYQGSFQKHNTKDLYHQVVNIIDVYDEFVEDYSKNGKIVDNILWSVNLNKSFYCLLMLHQHDEMFKVKDLNKLLRFYIKRKVTYYKHFLVDEPNIEFIVKLQSKNLIIFAETIRDIRDNNE